MTTESKKEGAGSSLRSDEPIRTQDQDRLARTHLVEVIGRHILDADAPESVVFALNAPWGAGKSSFLNLLEQRLVPRASGNVDASEERDDQPIVIRFNPWHYTSVDQLVGMFFGELARGIGTSSRKELAKKIGEGLRAVGSIAGIFHSAAASFIKEAGGALKEGKSLPELKRELDKLLPGLAQRVVVFDDDIDRLESDTLLLAVPHDPPQRGFRPAPSVARARPSVTACSCSRSTSQEFHTAALVRTPSRGALAGPFQLDELETFEGDRRLRPVTMPLLLEEPSRFIVHVEVAPLPSRGGLSKKHQKRRREMEALEGVRRSGSREAVKHCFERLASVLRPGALVIIRTDMKSSYVTLLAEVMPGPYRHERTSGKEPKDEQNPLWVINHTQAMCRDAASRLVRRSWGVSKERAWLELHAWVWVAYRNYIRGFTNKKKRVTAAQLAGVVDRRYTKHSFFEWRVLDAA